MLLNFYVQYRLEQRNEGNYPTPPQHVNYKDPTSLKSNERWGLYWKWVDDYYKSLIANLEIMEKQYRQVYKEYEEIKLIDDIRIMKTMKVIGMTTTGAARYQTTLQAIKSPIGKEFRKKKN